MRLAVRISLALVGLGPTQTSKRSHVAQMPGAAFSCAHRRHLPAQTLRDLTQRQLAQGEQVRLLKKMLECPFGLLRHVNLSFAQAIHQLFRRDVHELDVVGLFKDGVGQGLADHDAGDLRDDIVDAFDMLHVKGRVDIDAGLQEFLDILPAFGVPGALGVGVGQFIDENKRRPGARPASRSSSRKVTPR